MIVKLLDFPVKDAIIIFTSVLLILCLIEIRRLKKSIIHEIHARLIPQLSLEIDEKENCFYLLNYSFFLAQSIKIQDVELTLDDYGYKSRITLKFSSLDMLKPQEKIKLAFQVFDKGYYSEELTEKIFPHLIPASFQLKLYYSNIENVQFAVLFAKEGASFKSKGIESSLA